MEGAPHVREAWVRGQHFLTLQLSIAIAILLVQVLPFLQTMRRIGDETAQPKRHKHTYTSTWKSKVPSDHWDALRLPLYADHYARVA